MTLVELLGAAAARFRPENPLAPSTVFVFGFITPDACASLRIGAGSAVIEAGVRDAEYLIEGTLAQIAALLDPAAPSRRAAFAAVRMRPAYPFNDYLISIALTSCDLPCADLDYTARRFDGPYPFPPRYPTHENGFRGAAAEAAPLPAYEPAHLPELIAEAHPDWAAMYAFAWALAFRNLRQPEPGSGFVRRFIDPAFNACIFLWDTVFMTRFGVYGRRVFPFIGSLDNFYAHQHDDGFICREINSYTGASVFQPLDPRSTGPNLLAWAEWEDYQITGDAARLERVFPVLIAYHRWLQDWRTHPDGSYWTCGWGSGMDNQTRVPGSEWHHRQHTWVDATAQAALSCRMLLHIGAVIGRDEFASALSAEYARLAAYLRTHLWDERTGFLYDRGPDGRLSAVKSVGAYWALLADVLTADQRARLIAHLDDPASFRRPHRVPTQAADSAGYNPYGGYWLGGVWAPTNTMVLRGLVHADEPALAHAIACNHIDQVAAVFRATGTLWENYAPEVPDRGRPAGRDFVGWTGLSAISLPLEYGLGLRPVGETLTWDIRLTERHGVRRYPLGAANTVDLICAARADASSPPVIDLRAAQSFRLRVIWAGGTAEIAVSAGTSRFEFGPVPP